MPERVRRGFQWKRSGSDSTGRDKPAAAAQNTTPSKRLAIVGTPNVGKSVLFGRLTGHYVTVSNYPGTTVEVSRGKASIHGESWEVVDTPGMYSLRPLSEEERVARALLMDEPADVVLHVMDAKNLDRMLAFTLQLQEARLNVVVALNMMDEARRLGVKVDTESLSKRLGIPVVGTVGLTGDGMERLVETIHGAGCRAAA